MALLVASIAGAGAWLYTAKVQSWREIAEDEERLSTENYKLKQPFLGHYQPYSKVALSSQVDRGQFHSVEESVDERGAKIFLVQYSDRAKTIQYHDPRIQL